MNWRQKRLWELCDFSAGRGLEIGPLHNVSIPRHHVESIQYLDVFDQEQLRSVYSTHARVNPEHIPEIDFVLFDGERVRTIPEAVGEAGLFDWVIASHVIEHVPDAIGWLHQIAQVTKDGGCLVLAVPDRRYCFDVHRPGTTFGQMLEAYEAEYTRPSVRAVYDYKRGHVGANAPDIWAGRPPTYAKRLYTLETVQKEVQRAREGEYVDAHVWTFTPGSLLEQVVEMRELGLSEWCVTNLVPTRHDEVEFYMVLQRLPRNGSWPLELVAAEPRLPHDMPDWVAEWAELKSGADDRVDSQRGQLKELRTELRRARRQNKQLERRIAAMTTSRQWRIGGLLAAPVRSLRRLRR